MNLEWYEHAMIFCVFIFIFLFRSNVTRQKLDEDDFRCCCVFFFESIIPKVLDHSYVQSSLSTIPWHLDNGIWDDTLQLKILRTTVSSLHQDIYLIIVCFSFSQTSLVFKFNLIFIKWFLSRFIYLPTFWYCILKFIQYLYTFFIRASKTFMRLNVVFCEGLLPQNDIFLFSMKL